MMESNVKVLIRVRPNQSPIDQPLDAAVALPFLSVDETADTITLSREKKGRGNVLDFKFSKVLGPGSSQSSLYSSCNLVQDVLDGVNCCIIAYGQTSTGKSHAMLGNGWGEDAYARTGSNRGSRVNSPSLSDSLPVFRPGVYFTEREDTSAGDYVNPDRLINGIAGGGGRSSSSHRNDEFPVPNRDITSSSLKDSYSKLPVQPYIEVDSDVEAEVEVEVKVEQPFPSSNNSHLYAGYSEDKKDVKPVIAGSESFDLKTEVEGVVGRDYDDKTNGQLDNRTAVVEHVQQIVNTNQETDAKNDKECEGSGLHSTAVRESEGEGEGQLEGEGEGEREKGLNLLELAIGSSDGADNNCDTNEVDSQKLIEKELSDIDENKMKENGDDNYEDDEYDDSSINGVRFNDLPPPGTRRGVRTASTSEEGWGIIPRSLVDLFDLLEIKALESDRFEFSVTCQIMQIYNEKIFDLLQDRRRENALQLREISNASHRGPHLNGKITEENEK